MRTFWLVTIIALAGCASAGTQKSPEVASETSGRVTSLKVKGSLDKSYELPCIALSEARNIYTPPDLYSSSAKCVLEGRDKDAAQIFVLASAYGIYDGMRVVDPTAAQARQVLIMNNFNPIDTSQKIGFQAEMDKIGAWQSPDIDELCDGITGVGKPNYHPQYMILHGMAAFNGIKGDGLKPGYDAQANWNTVMTSLKCP
jgi:hypothetical protein